jgi:hypothetical protein
MSNELPDSQIAAIIAKIFGQKPTGGGGRVGRWSMMKNLVETLLRSPSQEMFYSEVVYDWSAKMGITPKKAEELIEHVSNMTYEGKAFIMITGDSPKRVKWIRYKEADKNE